MKNNFGSNCRSKFFALRGRRSAPSYGATSFEMDDLDSDLLRSRGRRDSFNHLMRGKKDSFNHLMRGKKADSSFSHLMRGE